MSLELKWWQCFQSKLACRVPLFEFDTVKEVHYLNPLPTLLIVDYQ